MTKNYNNDLKQALRDLLLMASERAQLETKIAKQKKRVAALYELVQTDEDGPALSGLVEGISDACRVVLRAAEKPMTPAEVRDAIQGLGLPPQANLLASVHTTLKRMKDAGEVKEVMQPLESGGTGAAYTWVDAVLVSVAALLGEPLGAAETFRRAHKAKLAREKAVKEMREAGSEVGSPLSVENEDQRSPRNKK
ncbi:MAG: hypothetical protein WA350_11070 [Candidatus Sulfotelmatobacter sp.]